MIGHGVFLGLLFSAAFWLVFFGALRAVGLGF